MWAIDGLANFLPYAGIPVLLSIAVALTLRRRLVALLAVVPLLLWVGLMATPTLLLAIAQDAPLGAPVLRVVTANVLMSNGSLALLARDVLAEDADIVVFQELRYELADISPTIADRYPFQVSTRTPWVTIASRLPLVDMRHLELPSDDRARDLLSAVVEFERQRVTIVAGHMMPPLSPQAFEVTRQQHELLNAEVRQVTGPLLVVGDFNATTLSPTFASFLWSTGLRIAASDRSLDPTYFVYGRLGIRIDHVLVRNAGVSEEHVFELTGSDHRGVTVDITLQAPAGDTAKHDVAATRRLAHTFGFATGCRLDHATRRR